MKSTIHTMRKFNVLILLIIFLFTFLSTGCRKPGNVAHMSVEKADVKDQKIIGDAIYNHIISENQNFPILDPVQYASAYSYMNTLLRTVLNTSSVNHRDDFDWTITILNDDNNQTIFTTPGGHVFIYTGFLRFIGAENELLSVVAHEVYYADTDMSINALINSFGDAGVIMGDILLGNDVSDEISNLTLAMANLTYATEDVEEADNFSIQLLCPFQYEAIGLKTLIDRMANSTNHIEWFDYRPSNLTRIQNIQNMAAICGMAEPTFEERYQDFVRKHLP